MSPASLGLQHKLRLSMRALLLPLLALAGLLAATGNAAADFSNTLTTTTAVVPGGTLVTSVPSGVTITASADVTGCSSSGIGTRSVTYTCGTDGSGVATGQTIAQSFSGGVRFEETVIYNANAPLPASIYPVLGPVSLGSCSGSTSTTNALAVASGGPGASLPDFWNCTGSMNSGSGSEPDVFLHAVVLAKPGQSVEITSAPNGLSGGCGGYGFVLPTDPSSVDAQVHYRCPGVSIPGGWHVAISVQTTGSRGAPEFLLGISPGPQPVGVTPTITTPTTQTLSLGIVAPILSEAGPPTTGVFALAQPASSASTAPVLASIIPATGAPGATVTLTGTNLVSGDPGSTTVAFGATQATNVSCSADGTSCAVTVPALDPGSVSVTLTNPAGTSNALTFTSTSPSASGGS